MSTFIQRNKKKSALAALLLFIRTRKTVSALLLVAILASFLFVSPSSLILSLPFGARVAAGIAWIAGKAGMDTSKWGLGGGKQDYGDLVAAFRAAKESGAKAGWSSFLRGGAGEGGYGAGGAGGAGGGSLDFVKGKKQDLETKGAAGEKLAKGGGGVQGVLNPDDAKDRGEGDAVALDDEDLRGEREGFVKSAFASGFANGSSGFSGGANGNVGVGGAWGGSSFGGGAYAGAGFFGGSGGAAGSKTSDKVAGGLANVPGVKVPKSNISGGGGRLSGPRVSTVRTNLSKGMVSQNAIQSQKAFVQLATGNGRAVLSVGNNCNADNGCPSEFAAVNTGVNYDGGRIDGDGTGILTTETDLPPVVPFETDIPSNVDPEKMAECSEKAQKCEVDKQPYYRRLGELNTKLTGLYGRMPSACSNPCKCGPCNSLKNEIRSTCDGELAQVVDRIKQPCNLPSYCAEMGISAPSGSYASGMVNMCKMQVGKCGCSSFFCSLSCFAKKF